MEAKERDMDIYSLNLISGQLAHGFKTIKILYFKRGKISKIIHFMKIMK